MGGFNRSLLKGVLRSELQRAVPATPGTASTAGRHTTHLVRRAALHHPLDIPLQMSGHRRRKQVKRTCHGSIRSEAAGQAALGGSGKQGSPFPALRSSRQHWHAAYPAFTPSLVEVRHQAIQKEFDFACSGGGCGRLGLLRFRRPAVAPQLANAYATPSRKQVRCRGPF